MSWADARGCVAVSRIHPLVAASRATARRRAKGVARKTPTRGSSGGRNAAAAAAATRVREAQSDDAEAIGAFDEEYTASKARDEITRAISRVHVALDETDLVGWLAAWHVPPHELQIIQITVSPAKRRRGIGRLLLQTALEAYGPSVEQVVLEVREDNAAAISLYERHGFERVGPVRKNYYKDGCSAVNMRLPTDRDGSLVEVSSR